MLNSTGPEFHLKHTGYPNRTEKEILMKIMRTFSGVYKLFQFQEVNGQTTGTRLRVFGF